MEAPHSYPIETFDPLLRDLIAWQLVVRDDPRGHESSEANGDGNGAVRWRLAEAAQRRLNDLAPRERSVPAEAVVYLDHRCGDCRARRLTRLHGGDYLCDSCWEQRQSASTPEHAPAPPTTRRRRRARVEEPGPLAAS